MCAFRAKIVGLSAVVHGRLAFALRTYPTLYDYWFVFAIELAMICTVQQSKGAAKSAFRFSMSYMLELRFAIS